MIIENKNGMKRKVNITHNGFPYTTINESTQHPASSSTASEQRAATNIILIPTKQQYVF